MITFVAFSIDLVALSGQHVLGGIPIPISLDADRHHPTMLT